MGLFLYTVGPVSTTEATLDRQAQRCVGKNNRSYICESGHCCEDQVCCDYFFELWWFWLVCAIFFFLTCCCVGHHRRVKHRLQQQQRQQEINLIAYREASNYTSTPFNFRFLPSSFLPDYEDVTNHPLAPPPPYCNSNSEPPDCTRNDQEEEQCPPRQTTPMTTSSTALCSNPDIGGLETSRENQLRDDGKDTETMLKEDMDPEDQETVVELPEEEKDGLMERRRHFTGDSGIEVCLCSRGTGSHRPKELEMLFNNEGHGSSMEFCDSCGARDDKDGEQGTELDASPPTPPQLHPLCLCLHTINEQEGPQEGQS
ncbi:WW domain binding protein 1-like b isoform X3 [Tachysurus fulvidraco]|uniref:WW domain binding protein 1-like b isoform X3 n=1 Tax=Tachysurus fulvidraco TaxID=1234273 RepID=UPI001FED9310|nr:WW domain binding protein 1-like b isoform X3 [Tachysurus fulvidraco]